MMSHIGGERRETVGFGRVRNACPGTGWEPGSRGGGNVGTYRQCLFHVSHLCCHGCHLRNQVSHGNFIVSIEAEQHVFCFNVEQFAYSVK